jgi:hypothetical protein
VVPRDKVKSSCDVDERVMRRLNAMETKVSMKSLCNTIILTVMTVLLCVLINNLCNVRDD